MHMIRKCTSSNLKVSLYIDKSSIYSKISLIHLNFATCTSLLKCIQMMENITKKCFFSLQMLFYQYLCLVYLFFRNKTLVAKESPMIQSLRFTCRQNLNQCFVLTRSLNFYTFFCVQQIYIKSCMSSKEKEYQQHLEVYNQLLPKLISSLKPKIQYIYGIITH